MILEGFLLFEKYRCEFHSGHVCHRFEHSSCSHVQFDGRAEMIDQCQISPSAFQNPNESMRESHLSAGRQKGIDSRQPRKSNRIQQLRRDSKMPRFPSASPVMKDVTIQCIAGAILHVKRMASRPHEETFRKDPREIQTRPARRARN
jgi:hypothetical protein